MHCSHAHVLVWLHAHVHVWLHVKYSIVHKHYTNTRQTLYTNMHCTQTPYIYNVQRTHRVVRATEQPGGRECSCQDLPHTIAAGEIGNQQDTGPRELETQSESEKSQLVIHLAIIIAVCAQYKDDVLFTDTTNELYQ